jgi:cytidyltransferase-like protein
LASPDNDFQALIVGAFDDLRTNDIRLLQEADRLLGNVHVRLFSDEAVRRSTGKPPKFPLEERRYYLQSIRFVNEISISEEILPVITQDHQPKTKNNTLIPLWVITKAQANSDLSAFLIENNCDLMILPEKRLKGFPMPDEESKANKIGKKKVMVSGCFDWVHTGHVRFFEEASAFGDLYVVVGHDANLRLLKGEGHPLFPQQERLYWVQSIRHVKKAMLSTGSGWLDAEPEVRSIKPDIFIVNEDGDRPEKRAFFKEMNIEYKVLERKPKPGLPKRVSTDLRGF